MCQISLKFVLGLTANKSGFILQALAVSLHLWGKLPKEVLNESRLLPQNTKAPSKSFLAAGRDKAEPHPHSAAQAFFAANHFQSVLGALKSSTSSHPRVHHALLATLGLLVPNFTSSKVILSSSSKIPHLTMFSLVIYTSM